jgi:hypothetical protein
VHTAMSKQSVSRNTRGEYVLACEQALFELSLKFEREPAGLANKNAPVRCLERRRVPIG